MESLQQFMADQQTPMGPPPRMGFQQGFIAVELYIDYWWIVLLVVLCLVNLFAFFNCTQHLGGYDEVTVFDDINIFIDFIGISKSLTYFNVSVHKQHN